MYGDDSFDGGPSSLATWEGMRCELSDKNKNQCNSPGYALGANMEKLEGMDREDAEDRKYRRRDWEGGIPPPVIDSRRVRIRIIMTNNYRKRHHLEPE